MYSMTVLFGASPVPWMLLFKSEAALQAVRGSYEMSPPGSEMRLRDDYGQELHINKNSIHGVLFEDMTQSRLAHIERALHQDRMNIEANNLRKADPAIAGFMRAQGQSPGVITPFGPNGAFRQ